METNQTSSLGDLNIYHSASWRVAGFKYVVLATRYLALDTKQIHYLIDYLMNYPMNYLTDYPIDYLVD